MPAYIAFAASPARAQRESMISISSKGCPTGDDPPSPWGCRYSYRRQIEEANAGAICQLHCTFQFALDHSLAWFCGRVDHQHDRCHRAAPMFDFLPMCGQFVYVLGNFAKPQSTLVTLARLHFDGE